MKVSNMYLDSVVETFRYNLACRIDFMKVFLNPYARY